MSNPRYATQRKWERQSKLWAVAYKGGHCTDCGFDFEGRPECAHFDHLYGRKDRRHGQTVTRIARERLKEELAKCDLVCANCHATRTLKRMKGEPA